MQPVIIQTWHWVAGPAGTALSCLDFVWRLLHRLDNKHWQKLPASFAKQRSINNTDLASVSQPEGSKPTFQPFPLFFYLFIITFSRNFFFLPLWKSSVFLITSGLSITNDTHHIAPHFFRVQKKMEFAFTLCSSILMKREIGEKGAFYLYTKCYARPWISAFVVRLSHVWGIC